MFAANPVQIPSSALTEPLAEELPKKENVMQPENTSIPESQETIPLSKNEMGDTSAMKPSELEQETVKVAFRSQPGPRFRALPREEQTMLRRIHQNMCHPSPEQLSAALRTHGCRTEVYQAVFDMPCSTCEMQKKPTLARPSTLKHELDFNDKIFMDGITWTSKAGQMYHFYHFLDQATNCHVASIAPSRAAEDAVQCFSDAWLRWAGPPNLLVTDSATELTGEVFSEFLSRHDIKTVVAAPHSHWQNGRCERHGDILQRMLDKIDAELPISSYKELSQALNQCTHSKNSLSIRKGFSPEVLVFGKSSRLPGSLISSAGDMSIASADREDAQGIAFRRSLDLRERARIAFHQVDNDQAIRRAHLRRTRPDRNHYSPGEWVMFWQPHMNGGHWFGPLKVIQQDQQFSVWATQAGNIHRRATEHVRPVSSAEAHDLVRGHNHENPASTPNPTVESPEIPITPEVGINVENVESEANETPNIPEGDNPTSNSSQGQPDTEPGIPTPEEESGTNSVLNPQEVPIPETESEGISETDQLLCCDAHALILDEPEENCAWRFELEVPWTVLSNHQNMTNDEILLASSEKKQRTEVRLSVLSTEEKQAFQKAKQSEVDNWVKTGTVSRILRASLAPEQILRCRWILTWKPLEEGNTRTESQAMTKSSQLSTHKPKARLVVLGYLDPKITELPRDSPTLGRQSKMLILQLISSMGWSLGSFDIRAAFLQGKPQKDRIMGVEPVIELRQAMNLREDEVCKLDKSAYGLIDAPLLWFQTLKEELTKLHFVPAPFDPCTYVLRHPETKELAGILGIHVDDGIFGGDSFFHHQISKLEKKYPFGSKKSRSFTFTGIDLHQNPNGSIDLSQTKYINSIPAIALSSERRAQNTSPVTERERQALRGLIGSLQYGAVHTRPDISCSLSFLQSEINKATVDTLLAANRALHTAKNHSDVTIRIQPIPVDQLRFIAFSDASFASKARPESHAGMFILATHEDIIQNKSCPISPLSWGTKKIQRVVTSTCNHAGPAHMDPSILGLDS